MSYTNFSNPRSDDRPKNQGRRGPMRDRPARKDRFSPYGNPPPLHNNPPPPKSNSPTVFVGNLSPDVTEEILIDVFKDCGEMKDVRLKRHRDTGKAKGFGFIDFYKMSCAYKAIETKNGVFILGRPVQVEISNSQQQEKSVDPRFNVKSYLEKIKSDSHSQNPNMGLVSQQPLLNALQMPLYPSNIPNIPFNPTQGHYQPPPNSGPPLASDKDFISKRSNDRVEQPQRDRPLGCKTVFIGNLLNSVKEDDIRRVFSGCSIKDVRWLYDKKNGERKFKGCGFVDFNDEESTLKAASMNGCHVLGRPMRVDYASDSKKKSNDASPPHQSSSSNPPHSSNPNHLQPYVPSSSIPNTGQYPQSYPLQGYTQQSNNTTSPYSSYYLNNQAYVATSQSPTTQTYGPTSQPSTSQPTYIATSQAPSQTYPGTQSPSQSYVPSPQTTSQSYIPSQSSSSQQYLPTPQPQPQQYLQTQPQSTQQSQSYLPTTDTSTQPSNVTSTYGSQRYFN